MQINTSLTTEQNLLAMINEANTAQTLDLTQISFGPPHQTGTEPAGHNTTVTVTAIKGSGYAGTQDINYQRIELDQALAGLSSIVQIPDSATTTQDTIDAITVHFGLVGGEFALNTAQSTRPPDGVKLEVPASLKPNGGSYLYTGPDIAITLKWNALSDQPSFLLDQTSAIASPAFSLRRLRTAYTGPAVNIRRASDNATEDIDFAADGTLDTTALERFLAGAGGFVTLWYDQSSQGLHAVQPFTTAQPGIATTADNGKPAVTFTGNQLLNLAAPVNQPYNAYGVSEVQSAWARIIMLGGDNAACLLSSPTEALLRDLYDQGANYEGSVPATFCLLEGDCDASGQGGLLLNGVQVATGSLGSQSFTHIGFRGTYNQYSNGSIAELLVFGSDTSGTDRATINVNISTTYGIAIPQSS